MAYNRLRAFLGSTQHPVLVIVHNVVKHGSIGWIEWHVQEAKLCADGVTASCDNVTLGSECVAIAVQS